MRKPIGTVIVVLVCLALVGVLAGTCSAEGAIQIGLWDTVEIVGQGVWSPLCPPENLGLPGCKYWPPSIPKSGVGTVIASSEYGWKWGEYYRVETQSAIGWYKASSLRLLRKYMPLPVILKTPKPAVQPTSIPSPTPIPQSTPTYQPCRLIHIARGGETLLGIALKYGTSVEWLAERNGIKNVDMIRVGQKICIW